MEEIVLYLYVGLNTKLFRVTRISFSEFLPHYFSVPMLNNFTPNVSLARINKQDLISTIIFDEIKLFTRFSKTTH